MMPWSSPGATTDAPPVSGGPSFTDDEYMSARNTTDMHAFYAGAPREMRRIAPRDIGAKAIGHFGFFRQRFADSLWPQVAQWLAPGPAH